jgi:hypothetical protein
MGVNHGKSGAATEKKGQSLEVICDDERYRVTPSHIQCQCMPLSDKICDGYGQSREVLCSHDQSIRVMRSQGQPQEVITSHRQSRRWKVKGCQRKLGAAGSHRNSRVVMRVTAGGEITCLWHQEIESDCPDKPLVYVPGTSNGVEVMRRYWKDQAPWWLLSWPPCILCIYLCVSEINWASSLQPSVKLTWEFQSWDSLLFVFDILTINEVHLITEIAITCHYQQMKRKRRRIFLQGNISSFYTWKFSSCFGFYLGSLSKAKMPSR